jgi:hypothetical protein
MNRDELEKDLNNLAKDSRALFGDVEELDKDEVLGLLSVSGSAANLICDEMYARIDALVKDLRIKGVSPPQRYLDLLDQLRPAYLIPHNPKNLVQHARRCVAELLQGSRMVSNANLQFSFHRKSDLTTQDEQILKDAADRLRRRIGQSE